MKKVSILILFFAILSAFILAVGCNNGSTASTDPAHLDTIRRVDTAFPVCAYLKPDSSGVGFDVMGRLIRHNDIVKRNGKEFNIIESKIDTLYYAYGELVLPGGDSSGRRNVQRGFIQYVATQNVIDKEIYKDSLERKFSPYIKKQAPPPVPVDTLRQR